MICTLVFLGSKGTDQPVSCVDLYPLLPQISRSVPWFGVIWKIDLYPCFDRKTRVQINTRYRQKNRMTAIDLYPCFARKTGVQIRGGALNPIRRVQINKQRKGTDQGIGLQKGYRSTRQARKTGVQINPGVEIPAPRQGPAGGPAGGPRRGDFVSILG